MSKFAKLLLALAVISLTVGLIGRKDPVVDGLGKALAGVFLCLFFILQFFGPDEKKVTDSGVVGPGKRHH